MNRTLLFLCILLCSSCSLVYRVGLGVNTNIEWQSEKQIRRDAKKQNIADSQLYVLDTAWYSSVKSLYQERRERLLSDSVLSHSDSVILKRLKSDVKDDLQPVHVWYFDAQGQTLYHSINCYVDPVFPKMNWNIDSSFNFFPPRKFSPLNDSFHMDFDFILRNIRNLKGEPIAKPDLGQADYYVVVFWNDYMVRPSKSLIKTLRNYHKQHADKQIRMLYVNNTNAFIWPLLSEKDKEALQQGSEQ